MRTKYNAHKTEVDGIKFDSRKEARRWEELMALAEAGEITELERQRKYQLTPEVREHGIGRDKKLGHVIELPSYYIADFTYRDSAGRLVVEDVKSPATKTPQYILKRKLMLYLYNIRIREV